MNENTNLTRIICPGIEEDIVLSCIFMSVLLVCLPVAMLMKSLLVHHGKFQRTWYVYVHEFIRIYFVMLIITCGEYAVTVIRLCLTILYVCTLTIYFYILVQITTFNISLVVHGTVAEGNPAVST